VPSRTSKKNSVVTTSARRSRRCLACGTEKIEPRRRYCSDECRRQILWVLALSKGLLKAFNARYAAFSFTPEHVILDVIPAWSNAISRFTRPRTNGCKPAEDLKCLVLDWGREWHGLVGNRNSRSYASMHLLRENHKEDLDPSAIKPDKKRRPRLSKPERDSLKLLKLERESLSPDCCREKIKAAYKKMAKIHHPDVGGDAEMFKRLNEAHRQMLGWAENPQFTSRKALPDSWSYDGATSRWYPPL